MKFSVIQEIFAQRKSIHKGGNNMFKVFSGDWRGVAPPEIGNECFIKVGFEFRRHLHHFKGAALSVLMCLALHIDEQGQCFPGYELIGVETGLARDTVARAIDQLCNLEIEGQRALLRYRTRDGENRYVGGNHYILFPLPSEVVRWVCQGQNDAQPEAAAHSPNFPTLENQSHNPIFPMVEKANVGKSDLKKNHLLKKKKNMAAQQPQNQGADAPAHLAAQSAPEPLPDKTEYPQDCREGVALLQGYFHLRAPQPTPGKGGEFALWIKELRAINKLCAEYDTQLRAALYLTCQRWDKDPFTVSHPGALIKTMTSILAQASYARRGSSFDTEVRERPLTPLQAIMQNYIPRSENE
jgi:hypothetical protein